MNLNHFSYLISILFYHQLFSYKKMPIACSTNNRSIFFIDNANQFWHRWILFIVRFGRIPHNIQFHKDKTYSAYHIEMTNLYSFKYILIVYLPTESLPPWWTITWKIRLLLEYVYKAQIKILMRRSSMYLSLVYFTYNNSFYVIRKIRKKWAILLPMICFHYSLRLHIFSVEIIFFFFA